MSAAMHDVNALWLLCFIGALAGLLVADRLRVVIVLLTSILQHMRPPPPPF